jgi:hypothetical protein
MSRRKPQVIENHYHVTYAQPENASRRRCNLCFCFPSMSTLFCCCSWMGKLNTGFWTLAFTVAHLFFAARCWGRFYAGMGYNLSGAIFHVMLFIMYIQSITVMERIGTGTHLLSIAAFSARVLWWGK